MTRLSAGFVSIVSVLACVGCSGGGGGSSPTAAPTAVGSMPGTEMLRVVHGSPDAGPIDVYVYAQSAAMPAAPTFANLVYPAISAYVPMPRRAYTVAIYAQGTSNEVATEMLAAPPAGIDETVALAGQIGQHSLQFQNFLETPETAGMPGLLLHHASPEIDAMSSPVGIAEIVPASVGTPLPAYATRIASFKLAVATTTNEDLAQATSGYAYNGETSGGEAYIAPIPSPSPPMSPVVEFAAGKPSGGSLGTVATFVTLSGLAANLATSGYGLTAPENQLLGDASNDVPAGAHLSVFAIDSATNPPGILIGTLDP